MPNHTILVVDDEKLILNSITDLLKGEGYEVLSASDGREALVLLGSQPFDLVISDLKLPDGIGGMDILQKSKAISKSTKVLILTAYADLLHAKKAKREGVDEFLSKPYDMEDLLRTVKMLLSR